MADPARQSDSVYDEGESEQAVTRPNLRALEGGGETSTPKQGHLHSVQEASEDSNNRDEEGANSVNRQHLKEAESQPDDDALGQGYSPDDNVGGRKARNWLRQNRRKSLIGGGVAGGIVALLIGGFVSLQSFKLPNFMANVDATAFARYQVDLRGRSSKWIQAYMVLRMGEVDDPKLAPQDRDNILFRADRVDNNKPLTDWYRTMRASKFERDLFESQGIKFTSVAYREGNSIRFKPGIITINDKPIKFDLNSAEIDAIDRGDVNGFNGRLSQFVDVQVFNNDKEGRLALKQMLHDRYPNWWNAIKRYHVRHDIQNMIGIRSWRFFENTRNNLTEKRIDVRNKLIVQMLPEDTRSGKFVQCLFGITECKATADPLDPEGRAYTPTGAREGDKTCADTSCTKDEQGKPIGDGSGTGTIGEGATGGAEKKITAQLLSKLNLAASIASILDSFSRFDASLHNHSLSKLVAQSKKAQAVGIYTVFAVASDQLKTGQVTGSEVNSFMQGFGNPTNNAAWNDVISPAASSGLVSAATQNSTFTPSKNEAQFCSTKHQAAIDKPENYAEADQEYQYLCPQYRIGQTGNRATELENTWNNGPGRILDPLLKAYHAATGGIFSVFNAITNAVLGPLISGTLAILGLNDDIKTVVAWVAEKALAFFGGGPMISETTPSGQVANVALEGGAALNEATMRDQGAAATTGPTAALATKNYLAYQQESRHSASFTERYLAFNNPRSLLSKQLFAFSNISLSGLRNSAVSIFGNALSSPSKLLNSGAHAATNDPYAAANFSGIETFDFPAQCLNTDPLAMTPQNSTNADDLGYFQPNELTWDLMSNKEAWADELYKRVNKDENKAMQVWNCALLDNTVRGGIGALYGYKGEDALAN